MRLREFAPAGGGGSGDYFQALASAWYNGVFNTGSLPKGIKTQEDVERLLNRGIVCPDGKTRKLHIDYNSDFDGVEIYSDDYYEHGDESGELDSRTGQPWGPYDHMEFRDEELDEGVAEGSEEYCDACDRVITKKPHVCPGSQGVAEDTDKYAELSKKIQDLAQAGKEGEANKLRYELNRLLMLDRDKQRRKQQGVAEGLNEFAADDGNGGGEDDALRNYARMWWAGDEATQMQIERALAKMGWEIGEDEGSYDNGGVFVVRAGDENGNSYTSWAAEDLTEGVAVDPNNPWGPQGRFVGDTGPAQISTTVPRHEFRAGDRVMYKPTGARATIENLYKNGTVARIHVASGMGGQYFDAKVADLRPIGQGSLEEKSTSQAQFRTMAAAAHNPEFARKVGIKQSVAREFNKADKGQSYKSLPKKA